MLYELAFTPDVFDAQVNADDAEHRTELRGLLSQLSDLGMVANLDKQGWQRKVFECLKAWPNERYRSEIMACLNILADRNRLVRHPKRSSGPPVADSHWFDLVRESHKFLPFDWVVTGKRIGRGQISATESAVPVAEVRTSDKWQPRRSKTIAMCQSGYQSVLPPILRHAKRLELVDPYLSPRNSQHFSIVQVSAELMGRRGQHQQPGDIRINTTLKGEDIVDPNVALLRWEAAIRRLKSDLGVPHSFRVFIWRSDLGDAGMHDRYVLTNQCGISVPGGLDTYKERTSRKTVWSLLDHEDYLDARVTWDPQARPDDVLARREIG